MNAIFHPRPSSHRSLIVAGVILALASPLTLVHGATNWTDISSPLLAQITNNGARLDWPGGCSGVVVNRTNGDVTIKVVGQGLWRSTDQGRNWRRIDTLTVSGRDETGWATTSDPNAPGRLASFSLDGSAGRTADGGRWRRFTSLGRNWDYGSVAWSPNPKAIIAAKHETSPPGEVYLSLDGGVAWTKLDVHLHENRDHVSMVGALDDTTFIYGNGNGILRSIDAGKSWTTVSTANPQTRIPVTFRGTHYLGTTNGLLVTRDNGVTWQSQGSAVDIWQGPFFGSDEKEMVVVGKNGVFGTRDGGTTWKPVASLKPKEGGFVFTPNWFGCYAWDPINHCLYVSSMGNPVYRLDGVHP